MKGEKKQREEGKFKWKFKLNKLEKHCSIKKKERKKGRLKGEKREKEGKFKWKFKPSRFEECFCIRKREEKKDRKKGVEKKRKEKGFKWRFKVYKELRVTLVEKVK